MFFPTQVHLKLSKIASLARKTADKTISLSIFNLLPVRQLPPDVVFWYHQLTKYYTKWCNLSSNLNSLNWNWPSVGQCFSFFIILDLKRNVFGLETKRFRVFFLWLGAGLEEEKDDFVGLWIVIQDIPDSMSPGNANQAITKLLIQYK